MRDIVYVKWVDSFGGCGGWKEVKKIQGDVQIVCETVGFLIQETDNYILLAGSHHSDNAEINAEESCSGDMAIPKCSILERYGLNIPSN